MTLTPSQLSDLERNARAELDTPFCVPVAADVALQLVAVYRAALAWAEARAAAAESRSGAGSPSPEAIRANGRAMDDELDSADRLSAVLRGGS